MDFQQLKTFYMVAKAGSFSKAVDQLKLSQPAISRQVMLLEETLKTRLFNRHARKGLILTAEGETLLLKTTDILRDIENIKASLVETAEPRGRLRIATTHAYASTWLIPHITNFMKQYGAIQVHVVCRDEPMDLTLREADIYIGPYNHALISHQQDLLFSQHLKLYATEEYLAKHGVPKTVQDLRRHRLLNYVYERDSRRHKEGQWIERLVATSPLPVPAPALTINSIEALMNAVTSSVGIAPLSEDNKIIAEKNLVTLLDTEKSEPINIYCVYLDQSKDKTNIKTFLSFLKSALKVRS